MLVSFRLARDPGPARSLRLAVRLIQVTDSPARIIPRLRMESTLRLATARPGVPGGGVVSGSGASSGLSQTEAQRLEHLKPL